MAALSLVLGAHDPQPLLMPAGVPRVTLSLPVPLPPCVLVFAGGKWPKTAHEVEVALKLNNTTAVVRSLGPDNRVAVLLPSPCVLENNAVAMAELVLECKSAGHLTRAQEETPIVQTRTALTDSPGAASPTSFVKRRTSVQPSPRELSPKKRHSSDKSSKARTPTHREELEATAAAAGSALMKRPTAVQQLEFYPQDTAVAASVEPVEDRPSGRWGHTFTAVDASRAVLFGGQGEGQAGASKDVCWLYETVQRRWQRIPTDRALARMGHAACYDAEEQEHYIIGGAKGKRFFRDIHVFKVKTQEWSAVPVQGEKLPPRSYASCTLYHKSLVIFGGNYPNPDPTPDGCSNDVIVFDLTTKSWCKPLVVGDIPKARSGHSATIVQGQLIIFGGWDAPECYNDVYALDPTLMEFTRLEIQGTAPSPRSWHLALPVKENGNHCILIHGGFDGEKALDDAFILDLDAMEWRPCEISDFDTRRAGHAAAVFESRALVYGGGDNEGHFFNTFSDLPLSQE